MKFPINKIQGFTRFLANPFPHAVSQGIVTILIHESGIIIIPGTPISPR